MLQYPKNQTYIIIPQTKASLSIGNFSPLARQSIDKKFIIWNFPKKSRAEKAISKDKDVNILSHDEALAIMETENWKSKDDTKSDLQNSEM